jgi:outer membrane lipoprotein-sorting protein
MRFALLAVLVPAFAVQGNDAEKLFRDMEKKIAEAKSLRVASDIDVKDKREGGTLKSSLALAPGNKVRMTMKGKGGGKEVEIEVVSDGNKLHAHMTPPGDSKQQKVPKNLHILMSKMISRTGHLGGALIIRGSGRPGAPQEATDPEKLFGVKDFTMGAAAKVNGRDAKVLHYQIDIGGKDSAKVTLWVDAKTLLPLKRLIVPEAKAEDVQVTETYTELQLNPQLDAKTFELPK